MDMPKARNLQRRGDRFYGRVAVPKPLRALRRAAGLADPAERVRSLHTPDRRVAERLLPSFLHQCYREFEREAEELRSRGARPLKPPTAEDLASIRQQFFRDTLRDDELARTLRTSPTELEVMLEELRQRLTVNPPKTGLELLCAPGYVEYEVARDAAKTSTERRGILRGELTKHLAQSEDALVAGIVEAYCQANGLVLERGTYEYKSLVRGLIKEWIKALEVTEQRDQGIYDPQRDNEAAEENAPAGGGNASAEVVDLSAERAKHPRKGGRIRDYFDAHLKECKPHLRQSDLKVHWATLRQFVECNGDKAVTEYGRSDMSAFKQGLKEYPTNAARVYPDVPFKKVLQRNRSDGHPTLSSHSVSTRLSIMAVFGAWLEENIDGVDASHFSTSRPKRTDRRRMEPFTHDEVKRILNSYAFTGCESERNYGKPGTFKLRNWHFWFTLIAAFTGARTNEIMQMDVADLRQEKDVWVFDISDDGNGKSLKTEGSRRLVPVHPMLIELGLLACRDRLMARGANSLFEGAPVDKDGRRAKRASKWFRKFLGKIGVKKPSKLGGAHRWRHTLTDALRLSGVDEYDIALVLGHKIDVARMTGKYGREQSMRIEKRTELLAKAEYPGVDFSLLMP